LRILAVDPGESNGWCLLDLNEDRTVHLVTFGTEKKLVFYRKLREWMQTDYELDAVIAEDFKVRPINAKTGSFDWNRMPAPQVLGVLEFFAQSMTIPFVLQQPSIKPVGYGFLGKPYVKGAKNAHHLDALAHGMYYLVTKHRAIPNSPAAS
jgi:hypothetical protein